MITRSQKQCALKAWGQRVARNRGHQWAVVAVAPETIRTNDVGHRKNLDRVTFARLLARSASPWDAGGCPSIHQLSTLLKQIAAPISRLNTIGDGVRQGHFYNLT